MSASSRSTWLHMIIHLLFSQRRPVTRLLPSSSFRAVRGGPAGRRQGHVSRGPPSLHGDLLGRSLLARGRRGGRERRPRRHSGLRLDRLFIGRLLAAAQAREGRCMDVWVTTWDCRDGGGSISCPCCFPSSPRGGLIVPYVASDAPTLTCCFRVPQRRFAWVTGV